MKTFEKLTSWMEANLERPLYEAEIARIQALRVDERKRGKSSMGGMRHQRKVALRVAK